MRKSKRQQEEEKRKQYSVKEEPGLLRKKNDKRIDRTSRN